MSSAFAHATIGTPGQPWGPEEVAQWRARQVRQRSHADDVLAALAGLDAQWQREPYGELVYGSRRYPLHALRSKDWQDHRPTVLVTGGVHGYETSGVHGALRFACERMPQATPGGPTCWWCPASAPGPTSTSIAGTMTPSTPTARSASPARAGISGAACAWWHRCAGSMPRTSTCTKPPTPTKPSSAPRWPRATASRSSPAASPTASIWWTTVPSPQPAFQQAIIAAVAKITHIAPTDRAGPPHRLARWSRGVIEYPLRALGPVRQHDRRALHHHHRGLSRQPARHARAMQRRAGCGGVRGDRFRAGAGVGSSRRAARPPAGRTRSGCGAPCAARGA
jgi:hypothetical protein